MAAVVLPGDIISTASTSSVRLGPGLAQLPLGASPSNQPVVYAGRAGLLGRQGLDGGKAERWWVEGDGRRPRADDVQYVPALGEPVLGIVIGRHAEGYRVDIGGAHPAALDGLAFESATKRSKPNLKVGAVVYARVSLAHTFAEPEIECVDPVNQRSEGFGEMQGGMLIRDMDLGRCRALITPPQALLHELGSQHKFEVSIGLNGRVWVKSDSIKTTLALIREIKGRPVV